MWSVDKKMKEKTENKKSNRILKKIKALKICCVTFVVSTFLLVPVSLGLIWGGMAKSDKAVDKSNYNEANETYKQDQNSNLYNQYLNGELTISEYETAVQNIDDLSEKTYMTTYEDVSEKLKNAYITGQNLIKAGSTTSSLYPVTAVSAIITSKVAYDLEDREWRKNARKKRESSQKEQAKKGIEI